MHTHAHANLRVHTRTQIYVGMCIDVDTQGMLTHKTCTHLCDTQDMHSHPSNPHSYMMSMHT